MIWKSKLAEGRASRWVTRERPKIDRIACPWLIRRFIDPRAEILFVPTDQVSAVAARENATAFDIPGAPLDPRWAAVQSMPFLTRSSSWDDPGLEALAPIVRGADTDRHDLAPEAAGLHAVSLGLSALTTTTTNCWPRGW